MTVVIDTNVVPGMFRLRHPDAPLLDGWFDGAFLWAVSTEILLEYSEVVGRMSGAGRAQALLDRMDEIDALERNLVRVSPAYRFHLIVADPDDDKFADCAIAAEGDYIITEDRHFDVLRGSGHKPQPILLRSSFGDSYREFCASNQEPLEPAMGRVPPATSRVPTRPALRRRIFQSPPAKVANVRAGEASAG